MGFFCFCFFFFFGKFLLSEGACRVENQQNRLRLRLLLLLHRDESKLCSGEASWNERVFFPSNPARDTRESVRLTLSLSESPQTTFSCAEPTIYVLSTPYENVPSLWALVG